MRPMGIFNSRFNSRPKKKAVAENPPQVPSLMLSGLHGSQWHCSMSTGNAAMRCGTVSRRISGKLAVAMSLVALQSIMPISMFDCPEQSHTSPTSTSLITADSCVVEFVTDKTRGSDEARMDLNSTNHFPSVPVIAVRLCPANVTVTFDSGALQP